MTADAPPRRYCDRCEMWGLKGQERCFVCGGPMLPANEAMRQP